MLNCFTLILSALRTLRLSLAWGIAALVCGLATGVHAQVPGATVKTDQVRAELLAHAPQGIQA